jgi:hypothetical protein
VHSIAEQMKCILKVHYPSLQLSIILSKIKIRYSDSDTNYNAHLDPLFLYPEASPFEIFIIFKICFKDSFNLLALRTKFLLLQKRFLGNTEH